MKLKDKFLIVFWTIISLGFVWLYWKKKHTPQKDHLSISAKIPFDLNDLYKQLGSKANIQNCSFTHNKVRLDVSDVKIIDQNQLLKLKGISGVVISSSSVNLIVGNNAKTIAQKILEDK